MYKRQGDACAFIPVDYLADGEVYICSFTPEFHLLVSNMPMDVAFSKEARFLKNQFVTRVTDYSASCVLNDLGFWQLQDVNLATHDYLTAP